MHKIGFFVDNCIHPDYHQNFSEIMSQLFSSVEKQAKKEGVDFIFGWDYTVQANINEELFRKMRYNRIDGINWFGGGSKPIYSFSFNNFRLSPLWKVGLRLFSIKSYLYEQRLTQIKNVSFRDFEKNDMNDVVKLLNKRNENLELSPRYTNNSLQKRINKYSAEGIIAEKDGGIIGVLLFFVAPWSGWIYGKPEYDKSYGVILIRHPLELAVVTSYQQSLTPHLLFVGMKDKNIGKYVLFVDIFDRRETWLRNAYKKIGADEIPYDFGTVFLKNLSGGTIDLSKSFYIPTNLVISPYTGKY